MHRHTHARTAALVGAATLALAGCAAEGETSSEADSSEVDALNELVAEQEATIAELEARLDEAVESNGTVEGGDLGDLEEQVADLTAQLEDSLAENAELTAMVGDADFYADAEEEADDGGDNNGDLGSRSEPTPLGETIRIGDWEVTVIDAMINATDQVLEANQFNDPPADGHNFYAPNFELTYVGSDSADPQWDLTFTAVGDAADAYSFDDYCGSYSGAVNDIGELFEGGTGQGSMCWEMPDDDAETVAVRIQDSMSFDDNAAWMAVR